MYQISDDRLRATICPNFAQITVAFGHMDRYSGRMSIEDEAFQTAIIDQLNAELGAAGMSIRELAERMGRPYDSTRNYLRKERTMPLVVFLAATAALGLTPDELIARARRRLPQ